MKSYIQRFRLLVGVDAVLVLLILVAVFTSPGAGSDRASRRDLLERAGDVATISIDGAAPDGSSTIKLRRNGASWEFVDGSRTLPVDATRVDAFLKEVDGVTNLYKVAADKTSWKQLGLDGPEARTVRLENAGGVVLASFVTGSYTKTGGSVYLAIPGSDDAYTADAGMVSYVRGKRPSWLDLAAWTNKPDVQDVQTVRLEGTVTDADGVATEITYTVQRSGNVWKAGDLELDSARVESMIRSLLAVKGDEYAPAGEAAGAQVMSAELLLGNGRSLSLSVEAKNEAGKHPATSSQRQYRMYLPAWTLTEAFKPLESLRPSAR